MPSQTLCQIRTHKGWAQGQEHAGAEQHLRSVQDKGKSSVIPSYRGTMELGSATADRNEKGSRMGPFFDELQTFENL